MAAFWLGTVPALVGLVIGAQSLATRFRRLIPAAVALLLIAGGCFTAAGRGFARLESLSEIRIASQRVLESSGLSPVSDELTNAADHENDRQAVSQAVETLVNTPLPCCVTDEPGDAPTAASAVDGFSEVESH
jgi:hypothetical protein